MSSPLGISVVYLDAVSPRLYVSDVEATDSWIESVCQATDAAETDTTANLHVNRRTKALMCTKAGAECDRTPMQRRVVLLRLYLVSLATMAEIEEPHSPATTSGFVVDRFFVLARRLLLHTYFGTILDAPAGVTQQEGKGRKATQELYFPPSLCGA